MEVFSFNRLLNSFVNKRARFLWCNVVCNLLLHIPLPVKYFGTFRRLQALNTAWTTGEMLQSLFTLPLRHLEIGHIDVNCHVAIGNQFYETQSFFIFYLVNKFHRYYRTPKYSLLTQPVNWI